MKDRVRKVDVEKLDEATFVDLSNQVSEKVRKIIDEAIERLDTITETMRQIEQWIYAYPLCLFPEPDF